MRILFISRGLAVVALSAASLAFGAERARLSNGFSIDCLHHAEVGGKVRLYTSADASSYIDIPVAEVKGFETVPDPPPAPVKRPAAPLPKADLQEILAGAGQQHDLDVDLLASVVKAESAGNPRAVSQAGARGLMQLMPGTAAELGVKNSFAADENVGGGSTYLDALLTRYHENLALALAAYNAGPAAVDRYHGIPPYRETRLYVARVIREFNRRVRAREKAELH
ncbi:MAG: lytic transglycosylase domain-containing protein [Acidobacteriota bacterium]